MDPKQHECDCVADAREAQGRGVEIAAREAADPKRRRVGGTVEIQIT